MADAPQDPLEFLKSMWGGMGFPLPGMVAPTLDMGELDKRIADLKAVEGWLKMNLNMLQTTIQGLEVQRHTLSALQKLRQSSGASESDANLANFFADPANWSWNFMPPEAGPATPPEQAAPPEKKK
ncbi:MAG: PhaM family polyhydroxyalkanoate granule multifunctional regulatory protein [Sterolibacterium sp.]